MHLHYFPNNCVSICNHLVVNCKTQSIFDYTKYDSILKLEKWQSSNSNNFCKNDIRLPSVKCHMHILILFLSLTTVYCLKSFGCIDFYKVVTHFPDHLSLNDIIA